jgi:predicted permease
MPMLSRMKNFFRNLFAKQRADRDLNDEVRSFADLLAQEKIRAGVNPDEARRTARLELGGVEQVKEQVREVRVGAWLDSLFQDLRYAARMLRKNPGFTAVAVLTLALGIGANAAIFTLLDAVVLKTLPVANPQELLFFSDNPFAGTSSGSQTGRWFVFSSRDFAYFRDHNESFKELCAIQSRTDQLEIRVAGASGPTDSAYGSMVSGNFFSFLGLNSAAGRLFSAEDDRPGSSPVAVLNYAYWSRKFHNDPAAIGQVIEINGTAFTIIGVAPQQFSGVGYFTPNIWLPLAFQPQVTLTAPYSDDTQMYWLNVIARLKPGIRLRQAQAAVNIQLKQVLVMQTHNRGTSEQIEKSYIELAPGAGGISYIRYTYAEALQILMAIVGIVLLIVCANVANLLLSRSSARETEISIRLSIGASRSRLIRQMLTESLLLAMLGGALGILVARWGAQALVVLVTGSSSAIKISIDPRVIAFTAGVSLLAGILFGLVPALRASRVDLSTPIKGSSPAGLRFGLANGLVIFQIAASLVLLIGAGLFLRTLQKLAGQDPGFDEDHVVLARIDPQKAGYTPEQTPALYRALIERLEALPGVRFATVAYSGPLDDDTWSSNFSIEGMPEKTTLSPHVYKELVGPNYFGTQGIPIISGRDIGPQDGPGTPLVTVINESMAKKFFADVNPIGRRFSLGSPFRNAEAMTIVGVAADARYYSLREPVPPMEFCAALQVPDEDSHNAGFARLIEVRTTGDPRALSTEIRGAVAQVAGNMPATRINTLRQQVQAQLKQNLDAAKLSTAFAALALLLACIGLYGTMAYRVSRRTNEIGIRMTLGAQRANVFWLVTKECLVLVAIGLAIGVPVALAVTRVIASQLFGVRATDPLTFAGVSILLLLVALAACYIPARRAMRVDPMVALRHE